MNVNTVRNSALVDPTTDDIDAALLRGQSTLSLSLVNAELDTAVLGSERVADSQTINLSQVGNDDLTFSVDVDESLDVGSVSISLGSLRSVQDEAPYSLFGDVNGDILGATLPLGRVNLVIAVYSEAAAQGSLVAMRQLTLNIVDTGSTTGGTTTGGTTTGGTTTGGTTTGGTTTGGTTTGGTTTGGTTTGGTTTGGTTSDPSAWTITIETESINLNSSQGSPSGCTDNDSSTSCSGRKWEKGTVRGRSYVAWRGAASLGESVASGNSKNLKYSFSVPAAGTYYIYQTVSRAQNGRPLPVDRKTNKCNTYSNGDPLYLCVDLENDVFAGIAGTELHKFYMHDFTYFADGSYVLFPYDKWVTGGRVFGEGGIPRSELSFTASSARTYEIELSPRSNNLMIDAIHITNRQGSIPQAGRISDDAPYESGGTTTGGTSTGDSTTGGTTTGGTSTGGATTGGSTSEDSSSSSGAPGVVLPGTGGCSCERAELAAGVIPNANNTGACNNTFKKSYNNSITIDSAFIQANGGSKVVDSISVNGGIDIEVDGVKLCNFEARSVKIMNGVSSVLVQDGTLSSDVLTNAGQPSNFVIFRSDASGVFQRIKATGGNADAVRLSPVPAGKSQVVKQSYFADIAKYRDSGAHSDFIQTYPTVEGGTIGNWLVDQNYFEAATYSGVASGIATNAIWMAMSAGARFENNVVRRVNAGFWIEPSRTNESAPIQIKNNRFHTSITDFQDAKCGVIASSRLKQIGNTYMGANLVSNGTSINSCQTQ